MRGPFGNPAPDEAARINRQFRPELGFSGHEDIRFSPGWSQAESPSFWTYKMVWQIDQDPQLTEARLAALIESYFDGLSRAVAKGGERDPVSLQAPVAVFMQDGHGFRGRLRIYDAFHSRDWISLNARVQKSERGGKHLVVLELSPQPFEHEVWSELARIRVIPTGQTDPPGKK